MDGEPKKPIGSWTIHDIARVAKVSAKTVSRVANGETGVGDIVRARIARIIEEVGYQPHTGARSMRSRPRDCLGVTVASPPSKVPINQSFLIWLFEELYRVFGNRQLFLCWDLNPSVVGNNVDYARGLWQQRYGGCLVVGTLLKTDKTIARIHASGNPYLAMCRLESFPELSFAAVDLEKASYISTRYLLERGHKHVAMLKAFADFNPGEERRHGYLRAMEEAGVSPRDSLIRPVAFGTQEMANAVYRLLQDPKVTALVDSSGAEDAFSIREGARRAGRTLGKDVEIVSWTYTHGAVVMSEASAHVWLPVREVTADGLDLLASWFLNEGQDGPIQLLYNPTLYDTPVGQELTRPRHLFTTHK